MIAAALDQAIRAVCPIEGVAIGRKNDKATWRIDFKPDATDQQRAAARLVLEQFDPVTVREPTRRDLAAEIDELKSRIAAAEAKEATK